VYRHNLLDVDSQCVYRHSLPDIGSENLCIVIAYHMLVLGVCVSS